MFASRVTTYTIKGLNPQRILGASTSRYAIIWLPPAVGGLYTVANDSTIVTGSNGGITFDSGTAQTSPLRLCVETEGDIVQREWYVAGLNNQVVSYIEIMG